MTPLKVFEIYVSCRDKMEAAAKTGDVKTHAKNRKLAKVMEDYIRKRLSLR